MSTDSSSSASPLNDHAANATLSELFSSKVRAAVLGFMVAREESRFSLTELSRATGLSVSSIQHECYKLERLGVLSGRREGASRRYWLQRDTSFVPVLMWLVVQILGQEQLLRYALMDIDGLQGAIISRDGPSRLVLIGEIGFEDLSEAQNRVAKILEARPNDVNVSYFDAPTWREHVGTKSEQAIAIAISKPLVVMGDPARLLPRLTQEA